MKIEVVISSVWVKPIRLSTQLMFQRVDQFFVTLNTWVSQKRMACVSPPIQNKHMMTSSNGNIFRITGRLCGEFTGHWWIPLK